MSEKEVKIYIKVKMKPLYYIKYAISKALHSKTYGEKFLKDVKQNADKYVSAKINGKEVKFNYGVTHKGTYSKEDGIETWNIELKD